MKAVKTNQLTNINKPVFNLDLEKSILYLLAHNSDLQHNLFKLKNDDFYNAEHRKVLNAFKKQANNGEVITPQTVSAKIKSILIKQNIINNSALKSSFGEYFKKLKEIASLRAIQGLAYSMTIQAKEEKDYREIRNRAIGQLEKIKGYVDDRFEQQTQEIDEEFEKVAEDKDLVAVRTGFSTLDKIGHGFLKSSFNIIASAQGMGKSSLALNMVRDICEHQKKRVLYVSLEMDYVELHAKLISLMTGIPFRNIIFENFADEDADKRKWKQINNARAKISQWGLYRIGEGETTPAIIEGAVKDLKEIDAIFIDYLQLMKPNLMGRSGYENVSNISRELKILARKTGIPIVAISSISRKYADRPEGTPRISDLRDSGQIEYDASKVILLHRASQFREPKYDENPILFDHQAKLYLAKSRFSESNAIIEMCFEGAISRFREMNKSIESEICTQKGGGN